MKKLINLLTLLLLFNVVAFAQFPGGPPPGGGDGNGRPKSSNQSQTVNLDGNVPKGNSKIIGIVSDSTTNKAVEFANIALFNKATNKAVDGTMADENGKFSLTRVAAGNFKLVISFIGYGDKVINNLKIEKGKDLDLGRINLSVSAKMLDAVTVTGEKSMIEEKVDRLVYNAEKDLTSRGGDASDVLKKVPMLSLDMDGNPELRGSSNIKVLINNKPSTIVAASVADALKMIPADLIKSVEVITSPSSKYDAEGSGGIINIITKKSNVEGYNLSIDTGVGLRGSNLGLNGSYKSGKFGVTLGGFGRMFYNKAGTSLDQLTLLNGNSVLTQQTSDAKDNGLFGRYSLGLDYEISKKQNIAASINFGTRGMTRNQGYSTNLFTNSAFTSTSYRDVLSKDLSNSIDMSLDYVHTFKPQQEWSISALYSQNNLTNNFDANLLDISKILQSRQKNINDNTNKEFTLQTDYTTPIGTNQIIEFGVKGIFRQVNSDYQYQIANATGDYSLDPKNPVGLLNYNQNIAATYVSYTFSTANKYNFKLGTRYEHTSIDAHDISKSILIPSYDNLVPSVNISKSLNANTTLKLAYNNRIQRPGLQQLNPNFNAANPQNISIGNPNLRPEITNNVELGISTNIKKTYLNFTVFARQTNNEITKITNPSDTLAGAVVTTWKNIGKEQTLGSNIFGNFFITPKWTLNGGVDLMYNYLQGPQLNNDGTSMTINNSGFTVNGRLQSQLSLPNGWGIQAFGGMRGARIQLQGTQGASGMYAIGIKKDFANKKGSIGIGAENFFGGMRMSGKLNTPNLSQTSINNIYNQNIKLTFSYKLGNMKFVEEKKSKVKNDDVMKSDN